MTTADENEHEQYNILPLEINYCKLDNILFFTHVLIQSEDEYGFVGKNLRNTNLVVLLVLVAVVKSNSVKIAQNFLPV